MKEINDLLFKFLWDYKGDKIKRTEMIAEARWRSKDVRHMEFNKALKFS